MLRNTRRITCSAVICPLPPPNRLSCSLFCGFNVLSASKAAPSCLLNHPPIPPSACRGDSTRTARVAGGSFTDGENEKLEPKSARRLRRVMLERCKLIIVMLCICVESNKFAKDSARRFSAKSGPETVSANSGVLDPSQCTGPIKSFKGAALAIITTKSNCLVHYNSNSLLYHHHNLDLASPPHPLSLSHQDTHSIE